MIGLCRALPGNDWIDPLLQQIQNNLFVLGADLATPLETRSNYKIPRITEEDGKLLERAIDEHTSALPELKHFIHPGGCELAARLHFARTVCRRAERSIVTLAAEEVIGKYDLIYLNRLSDLLFTLARRANQIADVPDTEWNPGSPNS